MLPQIRQIHKSLRERERGGREGERGRGREREREREREGEREGGRENQRSKSVTVRKHTSFESQQKQTLSPVISGVCVLAIRGCVGA